MYLPTNVWDALGIVSYIMELLYRNGVNIIDVFLGHGDITMVVTRTGLTAAYDALRREVAPEGTSARS